MCVLLLSWRPGQQCKAGWAEASTPACRRIQHYRSGRWNANAPIISAPHTHLEGQGHETLGRRELEQPGVRGAAGGSLQPEKHGPVLVGILPHQAGPRRRRQQDLAWGRGG